MKYKVILCSCRIDGLCCLWPTVASTDQRRLHSWSTVVATRDSLSKLCLSTGCAIGAQKLRRAAGTAGGIDYSRRVRAARGRNTQVQQSALVQ